jgi:predicted O-methyltransferase YrrM
MPMQQVFTTDWFAQNEGLWNRILPRTRARRLLEIGSYEGASACWLIRTFADLQPIEVHCVDTWEGGLEHQPGGAHAADMGAVEARFQRNIARAIADAPNPVKLEVHKSRSDLALARLLATGREAFFDFVYIDGSHQAPDVLCDAVLAFRLLREGGLMVFDDYLWREPIGSGADPLRCPKPAIDAFVNLHFRQLRVLPGPMTQLFVHKRSG